MHVGEDVIGVIHAMSSKRRLFTVAEMELLYTIANQAAFAIVNAMLYQDARSKSHEMRRYFRRVAHAIGSALDEQDLPQLLADLAVEIMRADRCAIYRLEGDGLRLQATSHFRPSVPPDTQVPLGAGLCGWVARRGQSLVIPSPGRRPAQPRPRLAAPRPPDLLSRRAAEIRAADGRRRGNLHAGTPRSSPRKRCSCSPPSPAAPASSEKIALEAV